MKHSRGQAVIGMNDSNRVHPIEFQKAVGVLSKQTFEKKKKNTVQDCLTQTARTWPEY